MCTAMMKAVGSEELKMKSEVLSSIIENYFDFVENGQCRLPDRTFGFIYSELCLAKSEKQLYKHSLPKLGYMRMYRGLIFRYCGSMWNAQRMAAVRTKPIPIKSIGMIRISVPINSTFIPD